MTNVTTLLSCKYMNYLIISKNKSSKKSDNYTPAASPSRMDRKAAAKQAGRLQRLRITAPAGYSTNGS